MMRAPYYIARRWYTFTKENDLKVSMLQFLNSSEQSQIYSGSPEVIDSVFDYFTWNRI
jgi:hypothetical protein